MQIDVEARFAEEPGVKGIQDRGARVVDERRNRDFREVLRRRVAEAEPGRAAGGGERGERARERYAVDPRGYLKSSGYLARTLAASSGELCATGGNESYRS